MRPLLTAVVGAAFWVLPVSLQADEIYTFRYAFGGSC